VQSKKIIIHHGALGEHTSNDHLKCEICASNSHFRRWFKSLKFELSDANGNIIDTVSCKYSDHDDFITLNTHNHNIVSLVIHELYSKTTFLLSNLSHEEMYYNLEFNYYCKQVILTEQTQPIYYNNGTFTPSTDTENKMIKMRYT